MCHRGNASKRDAYTGGFALILSFLVLSGSNSASALEKDEWDGRQVMPKMDAKFQVTNKVVAWNELDFPVTVEKVDGEWLWVGKAWVLASSVVPLEDSFAYYTRYLQTHPKNAKARDLRRLSPVTRLPARRKQDRLGTRNLSESINVSRTPGDSFFPVMRASPNGNVHLAWTDTTFESAEILHAQWTGQEWSAPQTLSGISRPSIAPSLAVGSKGLHLTWMGIPAGSKAYDVYYSQLLQNGWTEPLNISNTKGSSQRPQVAVDDVGTVHVVWFDNSEDFFRLYHCYREAGKWSEPRSLGLVQNAVTDDPLFSRAPALAVDAVGNIHVVFDDVHIVTRGLFHSSWDGSTWSPPVRVTREAKMPGDPCLVADAAGNLHLVWNNGGEVWYRRFAESKWGKAQAVSSNRSGGSLPALCVDPAGGVNIVWYEELLGTYRIYYSRFDGTKWLPRVNLARSSSTVFWPTIAFQAPGLIHTAWLAESLGNSEVIHRRVSQETSVFPHVRPTKDVVATLRDWTTAQRHFERGEAAVLEEEWTVVVSELNKAISTLTRLVDRGETGLIERDLARCHTYRGLALHRRGNLQAANEDYTTAIEIQKRLLDHGVRGPLKRALAITYNNRGFVLQEQGEIQAAIQDATQACQLTEWKNWQYLDHLAIYHSRSGDFDAAIEWGSKARDLAPFLNKFGLSRKLSLYREGKAYTGKPDGF